MAHAIEQSDENTKANEFLFRRLTVEDAAEAHVVALEKAPAIGFDIFVISAPTPFAPDDCEELIVDAPAVVARYFPDYPGLYARKGWTMFQSIDRIYDASRARERLGFVCRTELRRRAGEAGSRDGRIGVIAELARNRRWTDHGIAMPSWRSDRELALSAASALERRRQIAIAGGAPLIGEAEQFGGIFGDAVEFGIVGLREIDDLLVVAEKVLDQLGMLVELRAAS